MRTTLDNIRDYHKHNDSVMAKVIDEFIVKLAYDLLEHCDAHTIYDFNKEIELQLENDLNIEAWFVVKCEIYVQRNKEVSFTDYIGNQKIDDCFEVESIDIHQIKFYIYDSEFDLTGDKYINEEVYNKLLLACMI